GDEQVGPDRGARAAFGDVSIDAFDELKPLRQVIEADDGGEVGDVGGLGRDGGWSLSGAGESRDNVVGAAQVLLPDDLGFAVDALTLAGVVVGMASDLLGGEASHVRSYDSVLTGSCLVHALLSV